MTPAKPGEKRESDAVPGFVRPAQPSVMLGMIEKIDVYLSVMSFSSMVDALCIRGPRSKLETVTRIHTGRWSAICARQLKAVFFVRLGRSKHFNEG